MNPEPSERELQSLAFALLVGNKDAAAGLGISEQTVKNYLTRLYQKLDVTHAAMAAERLGWLDIPAELLPEDYR